MFKSDSVTLPDANVTLAWGQNHTFNISSFSIFNRTIGLGDRNISIYANNSVRINATVWTYNFSNPETEQDELNPTASIDPDLAETE